MATSKFIKYFSTTAGLPLTGARIWVVPQADSYPTNAIELTADGTRDGIYYHNGLDDGEVKIYIDPAGGSSPTLFLENIYVGEERLTTLAHTHSNKALLDTFTQTEANLSDAVSKKHAHASLSKVEALAANADSSGALNSDGLQQWSVTSGKICSNAVSTESIWDLNITTDKLANGSVTNAKIAEGTITGDKLNASIIGNGLNLVSEDTTYIEVGAIGEGNILDDAITTDKILDGAVTGFKLDPFVIGDGLVQDGDTGVISLSYAAVPVPNYSQTGRLALTGIPNGGLVWDTTLNYLCVKTNSGWEKVATSIIEEDIH
ncbi:MAG: hypothetical protein WCG95_06845 [bacterium]